ncbi:endonuclease/exonuclease/phosphatase family protein [Pseudonocardia hierapolitana]|uniref:Endonuclease/exonuclease/phosphatase family protein n=1 Tax=Pseudonocardia hierapolitana TaxID=1128676 RepID=A0A561SR65_9PSEU|nr:endonuclease/exonuclease/phosphatase family protein [Pseudonocardia hierapolitana]TWF77342.1 endonuclease/exonuclease/phosphatase family protein [Pseudonocardia hierapolitana]
MPLHRVLPAALALVTPFLVAAPAAAAPPSDLRVATFNASLNRAAEGELVADLSTPDDPQAREVAEVVQRVRPDVLLINEFDHAPAAVDLFRDNYLERGQNGAEPVDYPHAFIAPSNTGVPSGFDLDDDGSVGGPNDALGFGAFPGQYGMLVLSRFPIDTAAVRTFQRFLWKDLPGSRLPGDFYATEEQAVLPLSSKSHWDVPVRIGDRTLHVLASHPTPPTFDGPEDRNGLRNADEIAFWRLYVQPGAAGEALYDDAGRRGGLGGGGHFVIMGDQNSDPLDGDSLPGAADQLLTAHRVIDPAPSSDGAAQAANPGHRGDPRLDTADFSDPTPGNLRVDYVLPSRPLEVRGSGVFWPVAADPLARLNDASDHHATWVDLRLP